jgi:hypothetical protein
MKRVRRCEPLIVVHHLLGRAAPDDAIAHVGFEIDPGAEGAPVAAQHHDPHVGIGGDALHALEERRAHFPAPRVQPFGTVQGDERDVILHFEQDRIGEIGGRFAHRNLRGDLRARRQFGQGAR